MFFLFQPLVFYSKDSLAVNFGWAADCTTGREMTKPQKSSAPVNWKEHLEKYQKIPKYESLVHEYTLD